MQMSTCTRICARRRSVAAMYGDKVGPPDVHSLDHTPDMHTPKKLSKWPAHSSLNYRGIPQATQVYPR